MPSLDYWDSASNGSTTRRMLTQRTLEGTGGSNGCPSFQCHFIRRSNTFFNCVVRYLRSLWCSRFDGVIASATSTGDTANSRGVTLTSSKCEPSECHPDRFFTDSGRHSYEVEELFHYIDKRTIFKVASKIKASRDARARQGSLYGSGNQWLSGSRRRPGRFDSRYFK